jgi:N-acyl-D-aspartate/D-glutamate deacylase
MADFDIAIRGGKLLDGTGNPWTYADVGIRDGRIAEVGPLSGRSAEREIDARGLVVAPGFIDLHTHSDGPLIADGLAQSAVRQGVTLDVIGESQSVAPLGGAVLEEYRAAQQRRDGIDVDWTDLESYFARLRRQGISINLASHVAPQQVKQVKRVVVGFDERPATEAEIEQMQALVLEAMQQGAVGLSSAWHGAGYDHADEVIALARIAREFEGHYGTHIGSEGFELSEELDKAIHVAEATGIRVNVYHLKARGTPNWGRVREAIERIEGARARGLEVTANQYPYTAMQHPWHRLVPRWVQDMPPSEAAPRFADADFRARVSSDPEFDQYIQEHGGWEGIVGSRFTKPELQEYEGRPVAEIAAQWEAEPVEVCFDLIEREGGFPFGVYHNMSDEDVRLVMRQPWVAIASDGSAINERAPGKPHPRAYGTNVRVLGHHTRDEGVLKLEDAVRKMTSLPAQILGLRDRGALREGCWADIAVFDPATVADTATFAHPQQYAAGVPYVLVNGVVVIDGNEHTGARPGAIVVGPRAHA